MRRRAVAGSLSFAVATTFATAPATAVTPVSPRLDAATHARVAEQLAAAGVAEVGHNSVVLAVLAALGVEPRDGAFEGDAPSPHLPKVSARAAAVGAGCAAVVARVRPAADDAAAPSAPPSASPPRGPVTVHGTFCRVGPARWTSTDVRAERTGASGGPSGGRP